MCRQAGLLVVLVVLLGACSAPPEPATPPHSPPPPAASQAAPYRLGRLGALRGLRALHPRGFVRVLTCPRRTHDGCLREGTERTRWLVGAQSHGADLPDGNGLVEYVRTIVTAWPTAGFSRRYADQLTRELRRYRGEYDIRKQETGPHTYTPGDRGRGELHHVSLLGWRGTGLRRVFHYVFWASSPDGPVVGPPSGVVQGGHFVLRRGRFVADVDWVARSQATDRRLSHLPARLVRGLS